MVPSGEEGIISFKKKIPTNFASSQRIIFGENSHSIPSAKAIGNLSGLEEIKVDERPS